MSIQSVQKLQTVISKQQIVNITTQLFNYIETKFLSKEGLYRLPGNMIKVEELTQSAFLNIKVDYSTYNINDICSFIKQMFRALNETKQYFQQQLFDDTQINALRIIYQLKLQKQDTTKLVKQVIRQMNPIDYQMLIQLHQHLRRVSENTENKMNMKALSVIWGPNLLYMMSVEDLLYKTDPSEVLLMVFEDLRKILDEDTVTSSASEELEQELKTNEQQNKELLQVGDNQIEKGEEYHEDEDESDGKQNIDMYQQLLDDGKKQTMKSEEEEQNNQLNSSSVKQFQRQKRIVAKINIQQDLQQQQQNQEKQSEQD